MKMKEKRREITSLQFTRYPSRNRIFFLLKSQQSVTDDEEEVQQATVEVLICCKNCVQ